MGTPAPPLALKNVSYSWGLNGDSMATLVPAEPTPSELVRGRPKCNVSAGKVYGYRSRSRCRCFGMGLALCYDTGLFLEVLQYEVNPWKGRGRPQPPFRLTKIGIISLQSVGLRSRD